MLMLMVRSLLGLSFLWERSAVICCGNPGEGTSNAPPIALPNTSARPPGTGASALAATSWLHP